MTFEQFKQLFNFRFLNVTITNISEQMKGGEIAMNARMVFGVLLTIIGLVYSSFSFIYAAMNPYIWNGIDGLLGSFLGTHMLIPFVIGIAVMLVGLIICFREAYREDK